MARTGGDKTKKRILAVAEKLFGTRGFDATSVDEIARSAGVNKALIYYHFKNKHDLIVNLFQNIIAEVADHAESHPERDADGAADGDTSMRLELKREVEFLLERKRILAVLVTEALKSGQRSDLLFRCAELGIQDEHGEEVTRKGGGKRGRTAQTRMVHEFFTGFIPLVLFVALRDSWCRHYGYPSEKVTDDFVDAFARAHVASHPQPGDDERS